jgi:polyadenylate-binding protein
MMPPRPRYPPGGPQGVPGMPVPAPYGQVPPYGVPGFPPRGGPRGPGGPGGRPTDSPSAGNVQLDRNGGPAPAPGAPRAPPAGGAPAPKAGAPAPAQVGAKPESALAGQLAGLNPNEQKQVLGEALYMKIVAYVVSHSLAAACPWPRPPLCSTQPELAGKITGMLLEMDNQELIHLVEEEPALNSKVAEALIVLHDYSQKETAA